MGMPPDKVVIHAAGSVFTIRIPPTGMMAAPRYFEQQAMRWSYIVRARERWIDSPKARLDHEASARRTLLGLGIDEPALAIIASAQTVVVALDYSGEEHGWAARLFPWEYVLPAATRRIRAGREFTVMRELLRGGKPAPIVKGTKPVLLFVQNAPGRLADGWSFEAELDRVERAMGKLWDVSEIVNPTLNELRSRIESDQPAIVHLTGFDNVQGLRNLREAGGAQTLVDVPSGLLDSAPFAESATLARLLKDERALQDGLLMTSERGRPRVVPALELASALSGLRHPPLVVGISVANSASRTAALLVGEGAAANAVGFQGSIDNAAADYFFETFYRQLLIRRGNIASAFPEAWSRVRGEPQAARGSGIALWSAWDLVTPHPDLGQAGHAPFKQAKKVPTLDVQPVKELNYAVLHNSGRGGRQGLFERFVVDGNGVPADKRISVDVCVQLGPETASYVSTFVVKPGEHRWNLTEDIHVPLTAGLVRSARETVNSSVSVELKLGSQVLERQSHRISLLPVDQWRDNAKDGQWLPSFVLPRDPAVMRAVQQAQRYVRVLRDDPTAGFEGYQAASESNPHEEELLEVDLQVQAIWATLVHDWRLGYINPPPGYSAQLDSQRLRTPSQVERNTAGTCIDLALLLAACLELVDIYPVVFLLEGHALPGYWRHQSYHEEFLEASFQGAGDSEPILERPRSSADVQTFPWQAVGRDAHKELVARIRARHLVPIETVRLTENSGFIDAIEAGTRALSPARDFHSLLDIVQARAHGVTPLPIVETEA